MIRSSLVSERALRSEATCIEILGAGIPNLSPVKRRGNRRYYQRQDVLIIRQIRSLLYDQGFTIGGARQRLSGDDAREEATQVRQIIDQTVGELEELLLVLKA